MTVLNAIHQKMHTLAQQVGADIDAIFFCPHAGADNCDCRKPKPGMFHEISQRYNTSLKGVPTVGDSLRDLQAGFISGCVPYLVLTGKGEKTNETGGLPPGTQVFPDLAAVVSHSPEAELQQLEWDGHVLRLKGLALSADQSAAIQSALADAVVQVRQDGNDWLLETRP